MKLYIMINKQIYSQYSEFYILKLVNCLKVSIFRQSATAEYSFTFKTLLFKYIEYVANNKSLET